MPRYRLTLAYDGTDFCGWQKQEPPAHADVGAAKILAPRAPLDALAPAPDPRDPAPSEPGTPPSPALVATAERARLTLRTVQEVVERAVREVVREPIMLLGASRTDAGVHARGQVAAFTCSGAAWPLARGCEPLRRALNSRLPDDVLVRDAHPAPDGFDPIAHCTSKGYTYALVVSPDRPLWERRYAHHIWTPLDVPAMNAAAAELVGEHDFAAFAAAGHGRLSTVRRVLACEVAPAGPDRLTISISGTGFLWNMVRIIAGTLVEAGRGRITPQRVRDALRTGDRRLAGPTLPPSGLCLEWIRYDAAPSTAASLPDAAADAHAADERDA